MRKKNPKISSSLCDIIAQCQNGKEAAWHELIDYIAPAIFSLCRKSRLSRDESFDIYGQVCLELVNSISSLRSPERIVSFAATITKRQIYSFFQKLHMIEYLDDLNEQTVADKGDHDPEKAAESLRQREVLLEALLKLPEKERLLLKALFFDQNEPSYKEIAARLRMPVSSIGPTRARALTKLCRILKRKRPKK